MLANENEDNADDDDDESTFYSQMIYEPLLPFFPGNKSITPNAAWWGIASHGLLGF